ncbi:hypothetical protein HID58_089592 [Brassica napus]|uniref:(rape) hypothetical protein n=1 Tax=Brassica napus TaxID=3708 RepID=A0A816J7C7_BRANA|nr:PLASMODESMATA CALLOSE-BINDING PROTEIN 2-like [Brassica napus]KAH0861331.1 hypothetical protein HID58_089592 [Brassica napus]CAF1788868.1 unnamed protein product [Brassica napus]
MAVLFLYLLSLLMAGYCSATWCVCKTGLSDSVLQRTLDYACGNGADCNPTHPKGSCFNPDNVRAHCSYAVNSFFQKKSQASESCNFTGTATPTTTDPSYSGCPFPSSVSGTGGGGSTTGGGGSTTGGGGSTTGGGGSTTGGGGSTTGSGGSTTGGGSSSTKTPGKSSPKGNSPITTFPGGNSPFTGTPTTGLLGGNITDATGTGLNPDYSNESTGFVFRNSNTLFLCLCSVLIMI